ncbi:Fic family protein [Acetobacterium woodii]|uniref:Filamentation protein Fic1 n=1 Tax=Acetobacterium woodii (strain ATCC 29683 / DSM 1030 / JCM 2381 / KCTC 1655 / WB1) TaxID=931626 RepID=H6LDF2_ACEWD|nr:Fic family protein [Acetobacterium woodii]AFA47924.1 filamentation protein Fic1 [Acetobacterium woodii DSM 1030]
MKDRYHLTQKENIFLAKKRLVQNIYTGAKLEGSMITFPETQTILDGVNVANVTLDDIQTILNLRDGWRYLLAHVEDPLDLAYLCKINEYIARNESLEWGVLRYGQVGISGTDYRPPIPKADQVVATLDKITRTTQSPTEQALDYFLYGTRSQLFWDGNKRTSLLIANKILIANGAGILLIPDSQLNLFNQVLVDYYNSGQGEDLKTFLYEQCLEGIEKEHVIEDDLEPEI